MLEMPKFLLEGTTVQDLVDVLLMYVGPQLFFVAFLLALALLAQSIWQRDWKKSVQPFAEMVICVLVVLAIPVY